MSRRVQRALTVAALVVLAVATVWLIRGAFDARDAQLEQQARQVAERSAADVHRVIERDVVALTAVTGDLERPLEVSAGRWSRALERTRQAGAFGEAASVNLLAVVAPDAAAGLADERRSSGEPFDLRLSDVAPHVVVVRVWPMAPNEVALGFDVTSNPTAEVAVRRSREERRAWSSAPLRLVQEREDQRATVIYLPLLQDDEVVGFANLAFRAGAVLEQVRTEGVDAATVRWRDADSGHLLASDGPGRTGAVARVSTSPYGPRWELEAEVPLAALTTIERAAPWLIGALGSVVVLAVFASALAAGTGRRRAELLAERRGRDLVQRAEELDRVNAELSELHRTKDRVLRSVTHDLRNPITVAGGLAGVLLDHDPPPEQRRLLLERIAHQATRLEAMVDELATAARLQDGQVRAAAEPVDVHALARRLVADLGAAGAVAPGVGVRAHVDPLHAERILTNLLTNAQRYGAPPIEVSTAAVDGVAQVAVRDHGDGVAPADRQRIFTEFTRLHDHGEGLGLGLAISAALADLNGGSLVVEDAPGGGACFVLRLPSAGSADPQDGAPPVRRPRRT